MISLISLAVIMIISSADAGVSYIRWGRTVCPAGASRLYKGYMAGAYHAVGGSGANYLCLHEQPKYVKTVAGSQPLSARIYGVEFEYPVQYHANGPFSNENVNGAKLLDQDLPCVVCYVSGSTDQLMVPGRQDCGEIGYDVQYKGYLVAEAHAGRQRGQYICLDEAPEGRTGGSGNQAESVVYTVEAYCGSLPCAPYVEGFEIPCSLCTY